MARAIAVGVLLALTIATGAAEAQAPLGGQPGVKPQQIPTSTPAPPGGQPQPPSNQPVPPPGQPGPAQPLQPAPGQPGQPGQPPPPSPTPQPPPTIPPTWTPLPTPTVTNTPTVTPYPTFIPRITPTLAWPTPGPSAFFTSRYVANAYDPVVPPNGTGEMRGRVLDWRGIGLAQFRVQANGPRGQVETSTAADGQYTLVGMAPGEYEVILPDFRGDPARGIPVVAGNATTLDWVESSRDQGSAPQTAVATGTGVAGTVGPATPTRTATPVPATLQRQPTSSAARPSGPEIQAAEIASRAVEQLVNAFLTGVAVCAVIAVGAILITRRRG